MTAEDWEIWQRIRERDPERFDRCLHCVYQTGDHTDADLMLFLGTDGASRIAGARWRRAVRAWQAVDLDAHWRSLLDQRGLR